jgi:hypothetical protein
MSDPQKLANQYVEVWNERDAEERRLRIAALWVANGAHYVGTRKAHGYKELEERITGSHEKNVVLSGNRFRAVKDARALRDVITFHWEMLPAHGDTVLAIGLEFLVVNAVGRIVTDYQFVLGQEQPPAQGRVR